MNTDTKQALGAMVIGAFVSGAVHGGGSLPAMVGVGAALPIMAVVGTLFTGALAWAFRKTPNWAEHLTRWSVVLTLITVVVALLEGSAKA